MDIIALWFRCTRIGCLFRFIRIFKEIIDTWRTFVSINQIDLCIDFLLFILARVSWVHWKHYLPVVWLVLLIGLLLFLLMYSNQDFKQVRYNYLNLSNSFNRLNSSIRQIFRCCWCLTWINPYRRYWLTLQRHCSCYVTSLSSQCRMLPWLWTDHKVSRLPMAELVNIKQFCTSHFPFVTMGSSW